jgi:hypothetical protein
MTDDVMDFIEWVNNYADTIGHGEEKIPPDPHERIASARFRRILSA